MKIIERFLNGCILIEPSIYQDERGYFFESFNQKSFQEITGISSAFVQENQAFSTKNVVRGLHLQRPPYGQAKLIRVLQGIILDVAVDVRRNSPTYGKYASVELSDKNQRQFYIPKGFAHGYSVLSKTALIIYKCDAYYNKASEDGLLFDDETLSIDWGFDVNKAQISKKDRKLKSLSNFIPVEESL